MKKTTSILASALALSSMSASGAVVIAGWGDFNSPTAPAASVVATDITGTAVTSVTSTDGGDWSTTEGSGRGESNDATWGGFAGPAAAPTTAGNGTAIKLNNARAAGDLDFTITNTGTVPVVLDSFHFDAYAFRAKAARTYEISVLSGDLTTGSVFASTALVIPANGSVDPAAHVDYDHSLAGLADHTLAAGESAVIRLAFSGGIDDASGGHHLFVDNIAVSGDFAPLPEPSSVALLGLGALGLFGRRRR